MTENQLVIYKWLMDRPGYFKKNVKFIKSMWPRWSLNDIAIAKKTAQDNFKSFTKSKPSKSIPEQQSVFKMPKNSLKRLYFDIETSPNVVYSWTIGYNLNVGYQNIIKERAIICICYKWEHENKVHSLHWNKGDDYEMIHQFYKIIMDADEIVGHNSDKFDIKWFKTRCLYHGIRNMPSITSIDTLKIARKEFKFNSNRLDYIGQILKVGKKIDTGGFELWKKIIENNDPTALNKMIKYCCNDVLLLERVFKKLENYVSAKTHVGVLRGHDKHTCPKCGNNDLAYCKKRITATGVLKIQKQCKKCGAYASFAVIKETK
jgi:DNA polymerase elongation subunit (family B)